MEIMMSVNEGTQTNIDGKEATGAERRLEQRRDQEGADKTRSRTRRIIELEGRAAAAMGESQAPA
jgi:hypothetical protein